MALKAGTIIKLPDGRVGTITYRHLDGEGGVWGEADVREAAQDANSFNDLWPPPEFMLRDPALQGRVGVDEQTSRETGVPVSECVGEDYDIIEEQDYECPYCRGSGTAQR
jgi:hypothetical protein